MLGAAILAMVIVFISWFLYCATAESVIDLFTNFNGPSAGLLTLFLIIDYAWIRLLVYMLQQYIFPYFPSWCLWCT